MDRHPLRREIITTPVVNDMVNRSGTTFVFRHERGDRRLRRPTSPAPTWSRARCSTCRAFWRAVEALDDQVDAATQIAMRLEARKLVERGARWLLHNRRHAVRHRGRRSTSSRAARPPSRRSCRSCWSAATCRRSRSGATGSPSAGVPDELAEQVRRDGSRLLHVRPRGDRPQHGAAGGGGRRGVLRPRRPAAARAAARTRSSRCPATTGGSRWPAPRCATTCTPRTRRSPVTCW